VMSLGIFFLVTPTEPRALRSTQPLKVSTWDFFWGKGGRCVWLTTYHPCSAETSRKSGALIYPEHLGPPWPVAGHLTYLKVHLYTEDGDSICIRIIIDYLAHYKVPGHRKIQIVIVYTSLHENLRYMK